MKTIRTYLEELPEPARKRALQNLVPAMADKEAIGPAEALAVAFYWNTTPEVFKFWEEVCKSLNVKA